MHLNPCRPRTSRSSQPGDCAAAQNVSGIKDNPGLALVADRARVVVHTDSQVEAMVPGCEPKFLPPDGTDVSDLNEKGR